MQRTRTAAVFALLLFVLSSTPSFAMQRSRDLPGDEGPIDRIVRFIERITNPLVHVLDDIVIPKP